MSGCVDPPSQSAGNYDLPVSQVSGQLFGHLTSVHGQRSRANDGNHGTIEKINVSKGIENRQRFLNLAKPDLGTLFLTQVSNKYFPKLDNRPRVLRLRRALPL